MGQLRLLGSILLIAGCQDATTVDFTLRPQFQTWCTSTDPQKMAIAADAQCAEPSNDQRQVLTDTYNRWFAIRGGQRDVCDIILSYYNRIAHWVYNNYNAGGGAGGWSYSNWTTDWNGLNFTQNYNQSTSWNYTFWHELTHHYQHDQWGHWGGGEQGWESEAETLAWNCMAM
jgi:hypothetical protein